MDARLCRSHAKLATVRIVKYRKLRDRSAARLSSSEILFEFMKDHRPPKDTTVRARSYGECWPSKREGDKGRKGEIVIKFRDMRAPTRGRRPKGFRARVGYTRLSCRDGCSIMSTCSTCQPLRLNRSPDYPMTHNARPARTEPTSRTDHHLLLHLLLLFATATPLGSPSSLPLAPVSCRYAAPRSYCGPLSNSRHVKAIPGIPLIVMQSRPAGGANRTGS